MKVSGRGTTIRDIAARAGVSISTVHLVLAGKQGPKEQTKELVLKIAEELNYQCNSAASSLSRGVTRIAALLPSPEDKSMFYYVPIWNGIRAYCRNAKDFNIELIEIPYISHDSASVPTEAVERAAAEKKLSGLIVLGDIEERAKKALRTISSQGTPIVLVNSDTPEVGRICCIQAENRLLGRVMGELLFHRTPRGGSILVCAGNENTPSDCESVAGIEAYLEEHDPGRTIYKLYHEADLERLYQQMVEQLVQHDDIVGCCSVTARGSVQLARALINTEKAGEMFAVGSDVFEENIENLRAGVFQNLLFKNPFRQGWLAAEQMFKHVFRIPKTEDGLILVKSEVVFQSSIPMYEHEREEWT